MTPPHVRKPLSSSEAGARIHNLVEQVTQHPEGGEPFRLAGSIEILVSDEELESGIATERRRQAEFAAAKFKDL